MMQFNEVNKSFKFINQAVYSTLQCHLLNPPNKRQNQSVELVPIVFGLLCTSKNTMSLRILLDSGSSATLIKASKAVSLRKQLQKQPNGQHPQDHFIQHKWLK